MLISEISKQVRDKCQHLNVCSCVFLFSLISGGLCARPLCRQHFRVASALEVRSGNPKFNSLPYRSLDLFLGRPALFNSAALVKAQLFCLRSNGILNSIMFRGNFCLTPLPFSLRHRRGERRLTTFELLSPLRVNKVCYIIMLSEL